MSDPKYHRLIIPFIRADQFGVDAIEILQVESLFPGLEETLEAMTDAITTWIERTDEGRSVWAASHQTLNIGDLLGRPLSPDSDLNALLVGCGVIVLQGDEFPSATDTVSYDRVLVNTDKLDLGDCP